MTKDTFLHELRDKSFCLDQYKVTSQPPKIINLDTKAEVEFKDIEMLYEEAIINGKPLKDIVSESEIGDIFGVTLDDWDIQILTPEEAKKYLIV